MGGRRPHNPESPMSLPMTNRPVGNLLYTLPWLLDALREQHGDRHPVGSHPRRTPRHSEL